MDQQTFKTIDFEPSLCREQTRDATAEEVSAGSDAKCIEPASFSGRVTMRRPTFDERLGLMDATGLKSDSEGQVQTEGVDGISVLRRLVQRSRSFYVSVELKKLADGTEYKSFEDLELDVDAEPVVVEIARALRLGFKPGKT